MPEKLEWAGHWSDGLKWMKISRIEDVALADLRQELEYLKREQSEIIAEGGASDSLPAPRAERLVELDGAIADLGALERKLLGHTN